MQNNIQLYINEQLVDETQLLRLELERANTALNLLKHKLGAEQMQALLADELAQTKIQMEQYAQNCAGELVLSQTTMFVKGLKAAEFIQAFRHFSLETNLAAMPEHYLIRDSEGGARQVIETLGCTGLPVDLRGHFQSSLENAPEAVKQLRDESFPIVNYLSCPHIEGDHQRATIAFHQLRDTDEGLEARLAVFFPKGVPQEMVEGHKWHLAIEWRNWAIAALKQLGKV